MRRRSPRRGCPERVDPRDPCWLDTRPRLIYLPYILIIDRGVRMKTTIPISDARQQLPQLVKQLRRDSGAVFTITVRGEAVAELRAAQPAPVPGLAARKLLEIVARLPKPGGKRRTSIAGHTKKHLYGDGGVVK
jgi:antitoxin (DNA-binding transcriptional repressor) of toxin-antitoxin stability system